MENGTFGTLLGGDIGLLRQAYSTFKSVPVDQDLMSTEPAPILRRAKTIREPVTVQGPGTFFGKAIRTLTFAPTEREGWWFDRTDRPDDLPVKVSIENVWTTGNIVSNIVLRSGSPHNYIRLVEHIVALRMGFDVENLMIQIDSGDPPLFDLGSMDLVDALEKAGTVETETPVRYVTVKEKVSLVTPQGKFLIFEPADPARPSLDLDCAIHFPNAIGRQRIQFPVNREHFRYGAIARTNTTASKKLYCQTIGKLFADVRNLGYTRHNVLIAGKWFYHNRPRCVHNGKGLEAVWHRAVLDLLAAVALVDQGRFIGKITSYKAGHAIDVEAVRMLYKRDLLTEISVGCHGAGSGP